MFLIKLFLISILPLQAEQWTVRDKAPYEIKALVESFKMEFLTDEEKTGLKGKLAELDALMKNLPPNDRYFLAKSTVYKWVLKSKPKVTVPESFQINELSGRNDQNELSPFAKWLFMSLKADIAQIISTPAYAQYLKEINLPRKSRELAPLRKRISLIRPWAWLFKRESPQQVALSLIKHQFNLLDNLVSQYKLFYRFRLQDIPSRSMKLTYFSLGEGNNTKEKQIDDTLQILDKVIEKHKKANLPLPTSDWSAQKGDLWVPKESPVDDMTSERQNLNLENPTPDPNYKAPKKLPKPVDDWL